MSTNTEKIEAARKKEISDKLKWLESLTPFRVAFVAASAIYWYIVNEFVLSKINAIIDEIGTQPPNSMAALEISMHNAQLLFLSLTTYLLLMILLALLVRRD